MTVAVRGTGSIGLRHLRVLRDRLRVPTVAIPVRPGRPAQLESMNIRALSAVDALASYPSVRSVVATDTVRHLDDARELLHFGDVLVEKPLAPSTDGVAELARSAARHQRRVVVGFCLRHHRGLQRFRSLLPEIGRIHSVRIECQSFLPAWRPDRDYRQSYSARRLEGGVLRDLAHELDYAVWLFGRPTDVCCVLSNSGRLGIDAEESADLVWRAPQGVVVSTRLDYITRVVRRRMTACGEHGTLEWDAGGGTVVLTRPDRSAEVSRVRSDHDDMLASQAAEFLQLSGGADAPCSCTLEEAAFIVALTDAAYASAAGRCWHPVEDWNAR